MQFDWEQEGYKRLHHLEGENADLRRENAYLRLQLKEMDRELAQVAHATARMQP